MKELFREHSKKINNKLTFEKFGYYFSDLSINSHKKVIAICISCGKPRELTRQKANRLRCQSCSKKEKLNGMYNVHRLGKNCPNYKDGQSLKKNNCLDCGTEINWQSKRCKKCSDNNKKIPEQIHYCIGCNKEISSQTFKYGTKRCRSCARNHYFKMHPKLKNFCIDCGIEISLYSVRCRHCANTVIAINNWKNSQFKAKRVAKIKEINKRPEIIAKRSRTMKMLWQNKKYREKVIRNTLNAQKISPNKPEKCLIKLLNKLLPNEYKFVGNGKIILDGFCPDFINTNGQKKIIEHFGCYWHKCLECGFAKRKLRPKDVGRLKTYKKYGYKTLIIWEHELKDLDKVKEKILEFNYHERIV